MNTHSEQSVKAKSDDSLQIRAEASYLAALGLSQIPSNFSDFTSETILRIGHDAASGNQNIRKSLLSLSQLFVYRDYADREYGAKDERYLSADECIKRLKANLSENADGAALFNAVEAVHQKQLNNDLDYEASSVMSVVIGRFDPGRTSLFHVSDLASLERGVLESEGRRAPLPLLSLCRLFLLRDLAEKQVQNGTVLPSDVRGHEVLAEVFDRVEGVLRQSNEGRALYTAVQRAYEENLKNGMLNRCDQGLSEKLESYVRLHHE